MPPLIAHVPILVAGTVLWLLARWMASVPLSRVVVAVLLIGVSNVVIKLLLAPKGDAFSLSIFACVATLITMLVLRLSFWRSALLVIIYTFVWIITWQVIVL